MKNLNTKTWRNKYFQENVLVFIQENQDLKKSQTQNKTKGFLSQKFNSTTVFYCTKKMHYARLKIVFTRLINHRVLIISTTYTHEHVLFTFFSDKHILVCKRDDIKLKIKHTDQYNIL